MGSEQDPQGCGGRRSVAALGAPWPTPAVLAATSALVAVTSQYTCTIAVAADGTPLANTIMWMDQRGREHNPRSPTAPTGPRRGSSARHATAAGNGDIGHVWL